MKPSTLFSFVACAIALAIPMPGHFDARAAAPLASQRHVESELLVKFRGGPHGEAAERVRQKLKHEVRRSFTRLGWQHIRLPKGMSVIEGMARYQRLPDVLAVEPNLVGFVATPVANEQDLAADAVPGTIPNDPQFNLQWGLDRIGVTNAWRQSTGSTNVVVAVIDTGTDYTHPDLAANLWRNPGEIPNNGLDDDGNGYVDDVFGVNTVEHTGDPMDVGWAPGGQTPFYSGTALAGILGAVGNNGTGLSGVNWRVGILSICSWMPEPDSSSAVESLLLSSAVEAFEYVIRMKRRGVNIVATSNSYWFAEYSSLFKEALAAAEAEGIVNVFASGDRFDNDVLTLYPSGLNVPGLLMVAPSDASDGLYLFGTYGRSSVHLAAPGVNILSLTRGPGSVAWDGSGAAAPHVAGAVALLAAAVPGASPDDLRAAILRSTDRLPQTEQADRLLTHGRLNVGRAMQSLMASNPAPVVVFAAPANARTRASDRIVLRFSKPMNRASVQTGFVVAPPMPGVFAWSDGDRVMEFIPDRTWPATNHTARMSGAATDITGLMLDGNYSGFPQSTPTDDFVWSFGFAVPNDDFAAAQPIFNFTGEVAGTTRGATPEQGEPDHAGNILSSSSVWYQWTPPAEGWVTFSLPSATPDPLLACYTGTNVQDLTEVASNDDDGASQFSRISFHAQPGVVYRIVVANKAVAGFGSKSAISTSLIGPFRLRWFPTPPPLITSFSPSSGFSGQSVAMSGTNFIAATRVLFNGVPAAFTLLTNPGLADFRLVATVPPEATTGPISIETPHGTGNSQGNFTVLFRPSIAIRPLPATNLVELSWTNTSGFSLQRADTPSAGASWVSASFVSTGLTNGIRSVTVSLVSSNRFFRLVR